MHGKGTARHRAHITFFLRMAEYYSFLRVVQSFSFGAAHHSPRIFTLSQETLALDATYQLPMF